MPYKLSGREVNIILSAIYEKHYFVADQLSDCTKDFPFNTLDHWKKAGYVAREVTPEFFAYFDRSGQMHPFNLFIFGRLHSAIEKGGNNFDEILESAVYAPLLKPNISAMRTAEMNMKDYLSALGGDDLLKHHFTILSMLLLYHKHDLHPLVTMTGEYDTRKSVDNYQALASEFYYRLGPGYDWQAIAHFLVQDTKNQAEGADILSKYGNIQVYKLPLNTACDGCKSLYTEGNKPKLYYIYDLLNNGPQSIPQRAGGESATIATCGPSHVWCECSGPFPLTKMEWWYEESPPKAIQFANQPKISTTFIALTKDIFSHFICKQTDTNRKTSNDR